MEEYRNDNMEPASGENGEVRNVPQKERTEDPTVPFPGQTSATESTPAQDTPDVQKPTADPASWNHWSNAQPARQEPHQDTAGSSMEANRQPNTQYTPLGNITGQSGSTLNPAWMQKSESGEYRYRPPYAPTPGGPGDRPPKKKKEAVTEEKKDIVIPLFDEIMINR